MTFLKKDTCKRVFDTLLSLILLFLLSPIYIFIFIALIIEQILTQDFGSLYISEVRVSKGKKFNLFKLNMYRESKRKEFARNSKMFAKYGSWSFLQKNESALRFFGKIMKKFYLDELGQIFNILRGDMTFVGPRPLPVGYELNEHIPRLQLKAGLVGFATNKSKNEGDTVAKQSTDDEYLKTYNNANGCEILKTDMVVVLDGLRAVIKAKGH